MKNKWIISIGIFMVLLLITFFVFGNPAPKNNPDNLPPYAFINSQAKEAYLFAKNNPDSLNGVNCHCGCMKIVHNGRLHSRGLLDCFMKPNEEFDSHGANCKMCYVDALEVKKMINKGKTKEEIKKIIDSKYN
ncbi:MAG: PCYCGC motif-containing (lipo)protein [Nanoarchaeota archaeon]|nr:PCYCGC motif-containing (lipo)protein [Nanoarchaeota archaeon]